LGLTALIALTGFGSAQAQCLLTGDIQADLSGDPGLPMYKYTLTVEWDMDSSYGLSHLDLVTDIEGGTCGCLDFEDAITVPAIGGTSTGEGGCTVEYETFLECSGDPSIPGVTGILYKFEPIEVDGCEPGPTGTGSFCFYSDLAPVPVDEEFLALVDKAGLTSCAGTITGVFPGMDCDPVPATIYGLDHLKSLYR